MFLKRSQSQEISHRTSTTDHIAPQYKKIRITWTGTEIYKLSFISNLLRAKRLLHNLPLPSRLLLVPVDRPLQNHIPPAVAHIAQWHFLQAQANSSFSRILFLQLLADPLVPSRSLRKHDFLPIGCQLRLHPRDPISRLFVPVSAR